jgi:quercetin dioxygenase-like cupin family protein
MAGISRRQPEGQKQAIAGGDLGNRDGNLKRAGTIEPLFPALEGARVNGALVTFQPGARTAWHTHPLGQNLIVMSGIGWTQCESGPKQEIRAGDVVSCPCGRRHWHGATSTDAMSHIAITEALDGSPVTWLEQVSDADYLAEIQED